LSCTYPWYAKQWADLLQIVKSDRLGHALLFSSREWLGADQLGYDFAKHMLCETTPNRGPACDICRSCTLFQAGNHPDFKVLTPLEGKARILIDQVRELGDFYSLKSHYEASKIVLIFPADSMNRAASNALLKLLEEPPPGALILLVTHRFTAIPMTVRSRCLRIPCERVEENSSIQWLSAQLPTADLERTNYLFRQSDGAPLKALAIANDPNLDQRGAIIKSIVDLYENHTHPLIETKTFDDLPLEELLQNMISITTQLIFAKFGCATFYDRSNKSSLKELSQLSGHLNLKRLYLFLDVLFDTKGLLVSHSGLREADTAASLWLGLSDAIRM